MALRVLLIDEEPDQASKLEALLHDQGHIVLARLPLSADLLGAVNERQPEIVVVDIKLPDPGTLRQMRDITRKHPRPIVMFVDRDDSALIRQAVKAGVSAYAVGDISASRIKSILDIAMAQFSETQALRNELAEVKNTLAERKIVEQAKGIIMQQRQCSEAEAYRDLRRTAMDRGAKLAEIARTVIEASKEVPR